MSRLQDLVTFWSRQMSEHALFLALGFVDVDLRRDARSRHVDWELFRESKLSRITLIRDMEPILEKVDSMAKSLRSFKQHVIDRLVTGEWIGWINLSFVFHMRDELDYFTGELAFERGGAMRPREQIRKDELALWAKMMQGDLLTVAHLLDATEISKIQKSSSLAESMKRLEASSGSESDQIIVLSKRASTILTDFMIDIPRKSTRSVIHPVLGAHIVREAEEFRKTIDWIESVHS